MRGAACDETAYMATKGIKPGRVRLTLEAGAPSWMAFRGMDQAGPGAATLAGACRPGDRGCGNGGPVRRSIKRSGIGGIEDDYGATGAMKRAPARREEASGGNGFRAPGGSYSPSPSAGLKTAPLAAPVTMLA